MPSGTATVCSENGKPVNTRKGPSTDYALSKAGKIPVGNTVNVSETKTNSKGEEWCKISWTDKNGAKWYNIWIMKKFLSFDETVNQTTETPAEEEDGEGYEEPHDPALDIEIEDAEMIDEMNRILSQQEQGTGN